MGSIEDTMVEVAKAAGAYKGALASLAAVIAEESGKIDKTWLAEPPDDKKRPAPVRRPRGSVKAAILAALPADSVDDICAAVGGSRPSVKNAVRKLVDQGTIFVTGDGKYHLAGGVKI